MTDTAKNIASAGLVDPTGSTMYPHRQCPRMLHWRQGDEHDDSEGNKALFGDSGGVPLASASRAYWLRTRGVVTVCCAATPVQAACMRGTILDFDKATKSVTAQR